MLLAMIPAELEKVGAEALLESAIVTFTFSSKSLVGNLHASNFCDSKAIQASGPLLKRKSAKTARSGFFARVHINSV